MALNQLLLSHMMRILSFEKLVVKGHVYVFICHLFTNGHMTHTLATEALSSSSKND